MPPRPASATIRYRPAKSVPGSKRPLTVALAAAAPCCSPPSRVRGSSRFGVAGRVTSWSMPLRFVSGDVLERELFHRLSGREAQRLGFLQRAILVPLVDEHAFDQPEA